MILDLYVSIQHRQTRVFRLKMQDHSRYRYESYKMSRVRVEHSRFMTLSLACKKQHATTEILRLRASYFFFLSWLRFSFFFISPFRKSSLWTLLIRFISSYWLAMRFQDGTAYAITSRTFATISSAWNHRKIMYRRNALDWNENRHI